MFILPPPLILCWDGLFTKKEFILSLSCVSGTIAVSVHDFKQFTKVKTSSSVPPVFSDSLLWQFWWLDACWNVIMLLELSRLGFLLYLYCSFLCPVSHLYNCFVFVIVISVMFRTAYYFFCLLGFLTPTCFALFTDIQFSLNQCFFFDNSCIDLSYPCLTVFRPLFLHNYCFFFHWNYFLLCLPFRHQFVLQILSVSHI